MNIRESLKELSVAYEYNVIEKKKKKPRAWESNVKKRKEGKQNERYSLCGNIMTDHSALEKNNRNCLKLSGAYSLSERVYHEDMHIV